MSWRWAAASLSPQWIEQELHTLLVLVPVLLVLLLLLLLLELLLLVLLLVLERGEAGSA